MFSVTGGSGGVPTGRRLRLRRFVAGKSVGAWARRVAALRIENWFDADPSAFVAQTSSKLGRGEPLTTEEQHRVISLEGKSRVRKHRMHATASRAAVW
jgi:hypothetical protein